MRKKILFPLSFFCVVLVGVVSCGKQDNPVTSAPSASETSVSAGQLQTDLKIVGYGPSGTEAGKTFNAQASGEAALWVKLNHPASGLAPAIWWGNHRLDSVVSGAVISALVPPALYAEAGRYPLQVRVKGDSSASKSSIVYFVVK